MGERTRRVRVLAQPIMLMLVAALLAPAPRVLGAGADSPRGQAQAPAPAQASAPKNQKRPTAAPAEYAGSVACELCHEEARTGALAFHKQLENDKRLGWAGRGCEACHGPAKAHTESADIKQVVSFKTAAATTANQACLSCHARGVRSDGRFFDAHSRNSLSCVSCHTVHKPKATPLLAEKPEAFCVGCHANVRAEFFRPYRHKLQEGAISCVDCHNPHGTPQGAQLRRYAGNEIACLKCHGDKRGPFVFEHPPVRLEGCTACHEPHGSVNPRMLNRPEQRFLCLECHTLSATTLGSSPPAFHDLRSPRFQNCTTCHLKIHGSYVNRVFLR